MHDNTTDTARLRLQKGTSESEPNTGVVAGSRRRSAEATPKRLSALFNGDMHPLASPVVLTTRTGDRYRLVASSASAGMLQPMGDAPDLAWNTRLALTPEENRLRTVRAVVQVVEEGDTASETHLVRVVWLAVTATGRRAYLVEALDRLLGVRARLSGHHDGLEPNRKLVYNPNRKCVNLVTVGAEALPRRRAKSSTDPRAELRRDAIRPRRHAVGSERASAAFVLVDEGHPMSERRGAIRMRDRSGYVSGAGNRGSSGDGSRPALETSKRTPTDELPAVRPMVRANDSRGCFTVRGQLRGMSCKWVGRTHLIFETTLEAVDGLRQGEMLSLGVVTPPSDGPLVWVVGEVSAIDTGSKRVCVEVDLRRAAEIPAIYKDLVAHWVAASDAQKTPMTACGSKR